MALDSIPPAIDNMLRGYDRRIKELERRRAQFPAASGLVPFVFTYSGVLSDGVESAPWYPELQIVVLSIRVSATTPPSGSDLGLTLRLNGSDLLALSLANGSATQINAAVFDVLSDSFVTMRSDTSSGAADVSVELTYALAA